jgi:uncharacterized protein (UPF0264 family)
MEPTCRRSLPPPANSDRTPALLVSVRSAAEASIALAGGAELIDIKEPQGGSLGRATPAVIRAVAELVAGRRPVSAALGELRENPPLPDLADLAFIKWGLSGYGRQRVWRAQLAQAGDRVREVNPACRPVAVAYADWQRAQAPRPTEVWRFAQDHGWDVLLLDTWRKDGSTLLDWISLPELARLRERSLRVRMQVALAGSLSAAQMRTLLPLRPDWFAVRGAVCRGGRRQGALHGPAVRHLVEWLKNTFPEFSAATPGD